MLTKFMYDYWYILDQGDKNEEVNVFELYRAELQKYLHSVFYVPIEAYYQICCWFRVEWVWSIILNP